MSIARRPAIYSLSAMTALLLFRPGVEARLGVEGSALPTGGEAVCAADGCNMHYFRNCIHGTFKDTDMCDPAVNCS
jgi:hypothetical protein